MCAQVNPTVRALEEEYGRQVEFVWVDIDGSDSTELMNRYGIRGIPNVVLLDSSGVKVEQLIGWYSPETYEKAIAQVLASETSD